MTNSEILDEKIARLEEDVQVMTGGELGIKCFSGSDRSKSIFVKLPYRYTELLRETMEADLSHLREERRQLCVS